MDTTSRIHNNGWNATVYKCMLMIRTPNIFAYFNGFCGAAKSDSLDYINNLKGFVVRWKNSLNPSSAGRIVFFSPFLFTLIPYCQAVIIGNPLNLFSKVGGGSYKKYAKNGIILS